jgi:hypothetical protein
MTRLSQSARIAVPAAAGIAGGPVLVFLGTQASPLVAAALMVGGVAAGAVAIWPIAGFLLTALVVPLERIGRFTNDSSMYTISLMRALGMLTLGALLLHTFLGRRRIALPRPVVWYGLYTVVAMVTLVYTTDWLSSVRAIAAMLGNLLFFFLVVNMVREPAHARWAVILWLACTVAIGVFTIYQWHNPSAVVHDDPRNATGERSTDQRFSTVLNDVSEFQMLRTVPRAIGTTSAAAVYGINLLLTLPFFGYLFKVLRGPARGAVAAGAAIVCYNVFLTNTRAAVITLGVTGALIVCYRLVRIRLGGVLVAALLSAAVLPFAPSALYTRIFDVSRYSLAGSDTLRVRLSYWEEALEIFADNWLLGVGIGNQAELPRRLSARMQMPPNSTVHNEYLQSLLETGLLGYPLLVAFVVCLHRRCRAAEQLHRRAGDDELVWLLVAARVAFWTVLFYAVQVDVLHFPLKGWWLAMGLVVVMSEEPFVSRAALIAGAERGGA